MQQDQDYAQEDQENYQENNYQDQGEPTFKEENYYHQEEPFKEQPYEIIPLIRIYQQLSFILQQIQNIICLDLGWCLLLLNEFKWDKDYLKEEYYNHSQQYLIKIGFITNNKSSADQNCWMEGTCEVCLSEDVPIFNNICNHQYCLDCWFSHIKNCLQSGSPFPRCMDESCGRPILFNTIIKLLRSEGNQGADWLRKYQKKLCELFITTNQNYQFCTGVDCNNCIKLNQLSLQTVQCVCGKVFCFRCQSDDHYPCKCEEKAKWVAQVLVEEANVKWIVNNAKICPFCKKAVERSMGCNFMACRCGKNFCYMCSQPWQPDHKDHFNCHIYKQKPKDQITKERELMQRLNHCTQRFIFNQAVANNYKGIDVFEKRKYLFKVLSIQLTESEFLNNAFKFAIECCEKLKWIYAFTYFHDMKGTEMKDIFEYSLGEYEKYKENLLKLLAVDLKKFMQTIQNYEKINSSNQVSAQLLIGDFLDLKKQIINLFTCTKNYKQKFVHDLNNVTEVLSKKLQSRDKKGQTKEDEDKLIKLLEQQNKRQEKQKVKKMQEEKQKQKNSQKQRQKEKLQKKRKEQKQKQQQKIKEEKLNKIKRDEDKKIQLSKEQQKKKEDEKQPQKSKKGFWSLFGRGKNK